MAVPAEKKGVLECKWGEAFYEVLEYSLIYLMCQTPCESQGHKGRQNYQQQQ